MGTFLIIVGFLGMIVFLIWGVISLFKKNGLAKKKFIFAGVGLLMMIAGGIIAPTPEEDVKEASIQKDSKKENETKAAEVKKKEEPKVKAIELDQKIDEEKSSLEKSVIQVNGKNAKISGQAEMAKGHEEDKVDIFITKLDSDKKIKATVTKKKFTFTDTLKESGEKKAYTIHAGKFSKNVEIDNFTWAKKEKAKVAAQKKEEAEAKAEAKAKAEAEQKAKKEAEAKAKAEAEQKAKKEAEAKAKAEAEQKAKEEASTKKQQSPKDKLQSEFDAIIKNDKWCCGSC